MSGFWTAILLSVVSALCYGAGAVTQRRLADQIGGTFDRRALTALMRHRLWWTALALNAAGALLHVAALAFGTLTVVQPLGTLALVFALPWAARWAARPVTLREWHGAILTVAALSVMLVVAPTSGGSTLSPATTAAVLAVVLLSVGALIAAAHRIPRPRWSSQVHAVAAGIAFGAASALTKTFTDEIAAGGALHALTHPAALGTIALAAAGALLSQAAYRGVAVGAPLATMSLANPVAAVLIGIGVMGEEYLGGSWGVGVAVISGMVAIRGVHLLAATTDPPHVPRTPTRPRVGALHR
ncbi:DMT family transporter [Nocardiopsis sediminis]|uniref:DMT family transporter n=1 Tax=Nocardiopsis sediminis TaxID=1778267 RepID=A0ABV8FXX0_9ACTN